MTSWRDVPGFEGLYQVSDDGQVKRLPRVVLRSDNKIQTFVELLMKTPGDGFGYPTVRLAKPLGPHRTYRVHNLVLLAFEGPCPEGMETLHADDDPTNSRLENLSYGTHSQNILDAYARGRKLPRTVERRVRCSEGHLFDEANTHWYHGERICRACRTQKQREKRHERRRLSLQKR